MALSGPTVALLCTNSTLFAAAKRMLDRGASSFAVPSEDDYFGQMNGAAIVVRAISKPCQTPVTGYSPDHLDSIFGQYQDVRTCIFLSCTETLPNPKASKGDLIIQAIGYGKDSEVMDDGVVGTRAVQILRGEAGNQGDWLLNCTQISDPHSNHKCLTSTQSPKLWYEDAPGGPLYSIQKQHYERIRAGDRAASIISVALVTGPGNVQDEGCERTSKIKRVVAYAKEVINVMSNGLGRNIQQMANTEHTVPPYSVSLLEQFPSDKYQGKGRNVLLVIPTENEFKTRVLESFFRRNAPAGRTVHIAEVPVNSDVGEQPYNSEGIVGAQNRIKNALTQLNSSRLSAMIEDNDIGTIFVASIENYVQTANISQPTDFGIIMIFNATTRKVSLGVSQGVTVPPKYVDRARRFGYEGNVDQGKVTVGQILAANVEGLDKKDYHRVLAGTSRYVVLEEAVGQLTIPW